MPTPEPKSTVYVQIPSERRIGYIFSQPVGFCRSTKEEVIRRVAFERSELRARYGEYPPQGTRSYGDLYVYRCSYSGPQSLGHYMLTIEEEVAHFEGHDPMLAELAMIGATDATP